MTQPNTEESNLSMQDKFRLLPRDRQQKIIDEMPKNELEALLKSWQWTARPNQLPPTEYSTWLLLAGRGFGKTRTASEECINLIKNHGYKRGAIVARSAKEIREVCIEGQSGILAIAKLRGIQATYEPSKSRITFPQYDAQITTYTSEEPDQLRGPEHDFAWGDETASWSRADDTMSNLRMGLRIGKPKLILTTTPRPTKLIKQLVADKRVHVTRGSTFDNQSNLAPEFIQEIEARYSNTRLGRQELMGEVLEDVEGAYWSDEMILRTEPESVPPLDEIVVAVDPAVSVSENSDYTAITVSGSALIDDPVASHGDGLADNATGVRQRQHFYVLHSEQVKLSPNQWAERVAFLFDKYQADVIIAEKNNGGDMVAETILNVNRNLPVETIHAKRGKALRAAPIVALYEQQRVHHVGKHQGLEEQMVQFPSPSLDHDDAVDSLTYSLLHLSNLKPIEEPAQLLFFPRP